MSEPYPQRDISFNAEGWALDRKTGAYLRSDRKSASLYTNKNGWVWGAAQAEGWTWPVANAAPTDSGSYADRFPTRYNWRDDVEEVARYLVDTYDVWCNTYYAHPPWYWREETSIDVWGPAGRGDPLDYYTGQGIFDDIWGNGLPPWIEWVIWQGYMWTAYDGWTWFSGDDPYSDAGHFRHIHFTFS